MSTFSSANVTDGNLLQKERTHRIKITYSRNSYALIRQLANGRGIQLQCDVEVHCSYFGWRLYEHVYLP